MIDLRGLDLAGANLRFAKLANADLSRANLSRASMNNANLSGAWLMKANLSHAWLPGSDLWEAQFDDANLQQAYLDYAQGANASTNQVIVVVLAWSGSEDELASQAESSEGDKEIFQVIQDKFIKARVPFWTALASLGKVKEWSASLEVSANLLAIKGTGGISVTFGR